jgi:hypothetical protein
MKLEDSERMFFDIDGKSQNVETASAEVFDRFISAVVEEIVNVDRSKWPIFQRWRIINACLPEEVLLLEEQPDGSLLLSIPEVGSSASEEKATDEHPLEPVAPHAGQRPYPDLEGE